MRKLLFAGLLIVLFAAILVWQRPALHHRAASGPARPVSKDFSSLGNPVASPALAGTNAAARNLVAIPAPAATNSALSRERDIAVNPYAGALREPGRSKREWDAGFIHRFQNARSGDPVQFELTQGVMAAGSVKIIREKDGLVSYVSGTLTAPEAGKFFFLTPPAGGKAGKAVGVIEFPASQTAYRIEPTGPNGDPELWQRRLDEVICMDLPRVDPAKLRSAALATNETENLVPVRPDLVPDYVPSYNSNIVSLQSYPGSPAVLLLDFAGGYTPTWGGVNYARPPVDNNIIKDIWKRVAEDYMPFNINVTTDFRVYQAAAETSRQRCCFTTTPVTAAGVAYEGSWNWGGDTPCWSVYYLGKAAAEVAAHEPGHTLGLSHDGQDIGTNHNEYYTGQGSGATGWCPIMGAAYYQPVTTFCKGEYQYANNHEDQLNIIVTANNGVTYRADDTGDTLATSRYLEVYSNNTVSAEGVIERTGDTDAFQFVTTGGAVSLTAKPVGDWADLAVTVTLADATDTIIASNNPQSMLTASISTNLPAGTYTIRVTGAGRNNVLTDGFSNYASVGYYSVSGTVAGARQSTRLTVTEHAPVNTVVGSVPANNPNSSPLVYAMVAGNTGGTFAVDNSGVLSVANNALLDYYQLATNRNSYSAQFELFLNITNVNNPALTELNRRVVVAVQKLYPPVPTLVTATLDTSLRVDLAWIGSQEATGYNVKRSTLHNGPYTTVSSQSYVGFTDTGLASGVTYYYVVSAFNANGESTNSVEVSATAQSVANYGFELPGIGSGNYSYNPAGGFWTFSGSPGNGSGLVANGSGFGNPNAPQGVQAAFVQSYGTISQTFNGFTPGQTYQISYYAAQRSGSSQHGGESWNVAIDNSVIKSNTPGSTSYTLYTASFVASAKTHTLSFVGTDLATGDNTVFIDSVSFSPALQPTAPAIVLTNPVNLVALDVSAPVNLMATVATNDNVINGVQFFADGNYLGQINNAPYNYAWVNAGLGSHTVFARVLFNNGSSADSVPVNFAVVNYNRNLGFEAPGVGSGNYVYTPGNASWIFSQNYDLYGSGIAANGSSFGNPNAPQGTQAALLQGYGNFFQTLSGFVPGTNYTITYSAAQRSLANGGESWNVMIDGNSISSNGPGLTAYATYTTSFTATAPYHTLAFWGTDLNGGDNTVFIDNISINPPLTQAPVITITSNTSPATALDVVGGQVAFTAAFSNSIPMTYQWQKIVNGVLTQIPGATNTTLILSNLQLSDAGYYRLQASNSVGVAVGSASRLTVSNAPAAVNGIVVAYAAQTGLGSSSVNFYPTWTVTPGSVIAGKSPSSVGSGNFRHDTGLLTDGAYGVLVFNQGAPSASQVTCGSGAGQSVTYTLSNSVSGYSLSNIVVYGGWCDAGRDQLAFTVYYSTAAAPTTFIQLASANFNPDNPNQIQSAARATLTAASGGPLATNVAALKFDFTMPSGENGYSGYSEIAVYGAPLNPVVLADTLPVTAVDVVGSSVAFTAGMTGSALSYQWQKVNGGVTNDIAGATGPTLTLNNLQLSDAASYQLRATNAYGAAYSTARPLTVTSVPAPVNNVVTRYAAQTGLGGSANDFYTTWTLAPGSLLAGLAPSSVGAGNFSDPYANECGTVTVLTDNSFGYLHSIPGNGGGPTEVTCGSGGAGQSVTYTLPASIYGYNLTNITVYGGWGDAGRDQQAYTIYYAKVTAPNTFIQLGSANYNPSNPQGVQSATRATFSAANGYLATNLVALKFDFTTPSSENGYCGYSEIQAYGYENIPPAVATTLSGVSLNSEGNLVMNIGGLVVGRNYEVQSRTNLTSGIWMTESSFTATTTLTSITNIISGADQKFYRIGGH